jgi:ABC-type transport system involved in multi-copper enzyme maturation permease subunit
MNTLHWLQNPVLGKELRVRMRSKRTPWMVSLYLGALGLVVFSMMYFEMRDHYGFTPSNQRDVFILLSLLQYGLIIFITPGLTAGAICGERERQTLSVLLTTNLSPWQVIIGKWLASLSFILLLILSSLPLYGLLILFGGISLLQIAKIFGVYIITILAIGSVGVCISTLVKRTGAASVATYAVVFAYTALLFLANVLLYHTIQADLAEQAHGAIPAPLQSHPLYGWFQALTTINPVNVTAMTFLNENAIFSDGISKMSDPYGWFLLFYSIIACIMLALAIFFFKRIQMK